MLAVLAALPTLAPPLAEAAPAGRALVIGIDAPAGQGCVTAATAVQDRLVHQGLDVTFAADPGPVVMREALDDFAAVAEAAPLATTLVYVCAAARAVDTRLFILAHGAPNGVLNPETQGIVAQALLNALASSGGTLYADLDLPAGEAGAAAVRSLGQRLPAGSHLALATAGPAAPLGQALASAGVNPGQGWAAWAPLLATRVQGPGRLTLAPPAASASLQASSALSASTASSASPASQASPASPASIASSASTASSASVNLAPPAVLAASGPASGGPPAHTPPVHTLPTHSIPAHTAPARTASAGVPLAPASPASRTPAETASASGQPPRGRPTRTALASRVPTSPHAGAALPGHSQAVAPRNVAAAATTPEQPETTPGLPQGRTTSSPTVAGMNRTAGKSALPAVVPGVVSTPDDTRAQTGQPTRAPGTSGPQAVPGQAPRVQTARPGSTPASGGAPEDTTPALVAGSAAGTARPDGVPFGLPPLSAVTVESLPTPPQARPVHAAPATRQAADAARARHAFPDSAPRGRATDSPPYNRRVARVQAALIRLGIYHGPVDGALDGETLMAVRAFQHKLGDAESGALNGAEIVRLLNP